MPLMNRSCHAPILASIVVVLIAPTIAAAATHKSWYWTETRAETILIAKLKIPCATVYAPSNRHCDVAALATAVQQESDPAIADACQSRLDPVSVTSCQIAVAAALSYAQNNLAFAKYGWPITKADCAGVGAETNFKYSRFSCKVTLQSAPFEPHIAHTGRLGITVTGPSTFRWKVI